MCAYACTRGAFPPSVSCAGWPAVTFLASAVAVIPTGTSCPEFQWAATNSSPSSVRKWRGRPWKRLQAAVTHACSPSSLPANKRSPRQIMCKRVFPLLLTATLKPVKSISVRFGKTDFHSLFWLPKSGRDSTEIKMSPAIKNRLFFYSLSRTERLLLNQAKAEPMEL